METFEKKIGEALRKEKIFVLQINLGKKCNLACRHCHVEAGPNRKEEISDEVVTDILSIIRNFSQIQTIDLTGGAPEMHNGFKEIITVANKLKKEVIVRTNLTIYLLDEYKCYPQFLVKNNVHLVASLPCYLEENVNALRGAGVFQKSIKVLKLLNDLGYGEDQNLLLDLVYNPAIPISSEFSLPPPQLELEKDYKKYLKEKFDVYFNSLITLTNMPIGRLQSYLKLNNLAMPYRQFLEESFNENTLPALMCKNQLSIDYEGNVYDCDFNQVENIPAMLNDKALTLKDILNSNSLDILKEIQVRDYCYGCTAGAGSSCGGALI